MPRNLFPANTIRAFPSPALSEEATFLSLVLISCPGTRRAAETSAGEKGATPSVALILPKSPQAEVGPEAQRSPSPSHLFFTPAASSFLRRLLPPFLGSPYFLFIFFPFPVQHQGGTVQLVAPTTAHTQTPQGTRIRTATVTPEKNQICMVVTVIELPLDKIRSMHILSLCGKIVLSNGLCPREVHSSASQ